ncbi:MAG: DUF3866 family protein [Limnochordaceae bacterium]|nr:DUF3866 family protein [Limnochordaceae bacterium]
MPTAKALHFVDFLGPVHAGEQVLLNTTAVQLNLGTGGYHFVIWRAEAGEQERVDPGHIMKLRYTPWQFPVLAVEEPDSPYHREMAAADSLAGRPVVALSLHSQLAPAVLACRQAAGERPIRLAYVMTDGAALPMSFSQQVQQLRKLGLLDVTVTVGHAFGGDIEAVGIHSGLLAAAIVGRADIILAGMGPGIVGTDTRWGTTALEQAFLLDAADALGGRPVAVVRLSGADPRPRHRGASHHTLTVLGRAVHARCEVALPQLDDAPLQSQILEQVTEAGIPSRHHLVWLPVLSAILDEAERIGLGLQSMGRTARTDPLPFLAAAAAGQWAAQLGTGER